MFGLGQLHQGLPLNGTHTGQPAPVSAPSLVMMYGGPPKANEAVSGYYNQQPSRSRPAPAAANFAMRQRPYSLPLNEFGVSSKLLPDNDEMEGVFEIYDSHLKTPVAVRPDVVCPTVGSQILFSAQHQSSGFGGRNNVRVCEAFQEGHCVVAEGCNDIHVYPEYLSMTRHAMVSWLENKEREFQDSRLHDQRKVFRIFCADLKEVVEVPIGALRFTRGLYVDPSLRARRARNDHQNQFPIMASQVPTACGLFAEDPSLCKWGRWCNQVHVENGWMQSKKNEFESWSNGLERRFNELPSDHIFTVHDPQLKTNLSLPKASIAGFSRGLFQGSAKKAPSVCMLFQRNRCTANACCNQIHVNPTYLQLQRQWVYEGRLSESERNELAETMKVVLETLSKHFSGEREDSHLSNDGIHPLKELNPQAQSYIPPPPPPLPNSEGTEMANGEKRNNNEKVAMEENRRFQEEQEVNLQAVPRHQRLPFFEDQVSGNREGFSRPMRPSDPTFLSASKEQQQQQQQANYPCKSISVNSANNDNSYYRKATSTGACLPLGDFVMVDEEPSQSSLQASQSNTSYPGRSYKHTNNPYTLGGSSSCIGSPSFGWVQPVRSAGNSCTTMPNGSHGGEPNCSNGNSLSGLRVRANSAPGTHDGRSALSSMQQDFDASFHTTMSFPSIHWNPSSSTPARAVDDFSKATPDMDHPNAEENGLFTSL